MCDQRMRKLRQFTSHLIVFRNLDPWLLTTNSNRYRISLFFALFEIHAVL